METTYSINNNDNDNETIEMINLIERIDIANNDDEDDDEDELSEFTENDFEKGYEGKDDDSLENTIHSELDSVLDFIFDYDIIATPEKFYELYHFTKIKNKIVNKIRLDKNDLSYIKKVDDSKKFELIKLFNYVL